MSSNLCGHHAAVSNATSPASTLNKKHIALAYHSVWEHFLNQVVKIRKIDTKDNYDNAFTVALSSNK